MTQVEMSLKKAESGKWDKLEREVDAKVRNPKP